MIRVPDGGGGEKVTSGPSTSASITPPSGRTARINSGRIPCSEAKVMHNASLPNATEKASQLSPTQSAYRGRPPGGPPEVHHSADMQKAYPLRMSEEVHELQPDDEPLADWEIQHLIEEEWHRRRRGFGLDDDSGDREPRRPGPHAGSGAAALEEPEGEE